MPSVQIVIDNIHCIDTEDFSDGDHVYYISFLQCAPTGGMLGGPEDPMPWDRKLLLRRTNAENPAHCVNGSVAHLSTSDSILFAAQCNESPDVTGSVYFMDGGNTGIDRRRRENIGDVSMAAGVATGVVAGTVTGAIIGGGLGALIGFGVLFPPIVAAVIVRVLLHIGSYIDPDKDDYLGGFFLKVPVAGPSQEILSHVNTPSLKLTGSNGISTDHGKRFGATVGAVEYDVTLRVNRSS